MNMQRHDPEATTQSAFRHGSASSGAGRGRPARGGFTLLELLVVIAVVTMLAALLFPVLSRARARARRTVCLSNMRQLAVAHQLYVQDWDEQLPPWSLPGIARDGMPDLARYWTSFLDHYWRSEEIRQDPEAIWRGSPPPDYAVLAEYVLLTWQQSGRRGDRSEPKMRWPGPPLSLGQVTRPGETIQWMDGWTTTRWTAGVMRRHGEGLNVVFVDGHARWMSEKEFWSVDPDEDGYYWLRYGRADR